jgi:hypothetical protein
MIPQYTAAAVALAALGVSVSAARSDQYPTLNTAQVCHGITEQSDLEAGLRQTSFDQCMKEEQSVRDTMIKEWTAFSQTIRGIALPKQRWAATRVIRSC